MNKKAVWTIVALVGSYVICQAIADIGATKLVEIGGIVMPAGTFIFAVTFTLRDMLHKRLGKNWARAAIVMAGAFNILMAVYLAVVALLPAPVFYQYADAWNSIFALVPAITTASIVAEVASEWVDTEVYHFYVQRFKNAPQWSRVVVSNAVSLPLDSILFAFLAFVLLPPLFGGEALPIVAAWAVVGGQIVFKAIITLISMPLIYAVPDERLVL